MKKRISILCMVVFLLSMVLVREPVQASSAVPEQLKLNVSTKTIYTKQKLKLRVVSVIPKKAGKGVNWKSSDSSVAKVDKNGLVTGIKAGTVTITATSKADKTVKASCKIIVKKFRETKVGIKVKKLDYEALWAYDRFEKTKGKFICITSYEQLKKLIKEETLEDQSFLNTSVYKQLSKYKKSYFKKNTLCILRGYESNSLDVSKEALYMKRVQGNSGKLIGMLYVAYKDEGFSSSPTLDFVNYQYYFVTIKNSVAKTMSSFTLIKKYK